MSTLNQTASARLRRLARRSILPFGLILLVFATQIGSSFYPQLVENYYSRGLYPRVLTVVSVIGRAVPAISIAEILLVLVVLALTIGAIFKLIRAQSLREIPDLVRQHKSEHGRYSVRSLEFLLQPSARALLSWLEKSFPRFLWLAAIVLLLFMFGYGMNYQRLPVEVIFKLDPVEPDVQTVETISREIVEAVNRSYAESGIQSIGPNGSELPIEITKLFEELDLSFASQERLGNNSESPTRVTPKPVLFSGVMSRMGISGVYSPLTGEPNFNPIQPDSALPFTLAHEIAHRRGFARESEASFIAFLVCINSKNAYVRYSGYLQALRVLSLLRVKSPERHPAVLALLAEGPRVDVRASQEFWRRYSGRLSAATRSLNDAYLRANRVKSGIRNYGEVTTLIIAHYVTEQR